MLELQNVSFEVEGEQEKKEILKDFNPAALLTEIADKATLDSKMTVLKLIL